VRVLITLVAMSSGCAIDALDYAGKSCPCYEGWTCECGQCVQANDCAPRITATGFRVGWTTPNTIRWEWDPDPAASAEEFQRYEVCVGTADPEGEESGTTKVWTAADNAELGGLGLSHVGGPFDPVRATVTDGLVDETSYWGQLRAFDNAGCSWASPVVTALTEVEPKDQNEAVLFRDVLLGDPFPVPDVHLVADAALAYRGSAYLGYDPACNDPMPSCQCCESARVGGMMADISGVAFDVDKTAFLELAVATPEPSAWSTVYFALLNNGVEEFWRFEPYSLSPAADGSYRVLQIPLSALSNDNSETLTQADIALPLSQFAINGNWALDGHLRIDEVRIRW
jgi:hypothetical protein